MPSSLLESSLSVLRLAPKLVQALQTELGIYSLEDLLMYAPFRYNDRTKVTFYAQIQNTTTPVQLVATLEHIAYSGEGTKKRLEVQFRDPSGVFQVLFFKGHQYIYKQLSIGTRYVLWGRPSLFMHTYNFVHPELEPLAEGRSPNLALEPVYEVTEKLKRQYVHSRRMMQIQGTCLRFLAGRIEEILPQYILDKYHLLSRADAFLRLHFPRQMSDADNARLRFKYEEWFCLQLEQAEFLVRDTQVRGIVCSRVGELFNSFYKEHLAFSLTEAQKRVLRDIHADMKSGRQMNRLLQGDVGSGKTLVALFSLLLAVDNGLQGCLMAPTEILATQHYRSICRMLGDMPVRVELLTGSTTQKERRPIHEGLRDGAVNILIGTHALIEDEVVFHNLGLVIVDEQHRFGVAQRAKLWGKNPEILPHILVMSATPIPRTLALTVYAGLDISVIDELPVGRKPIETRILHENQREQLYNFLRQEMAQGHQVYVVYPLVNESEALDLKSVTEGYERMGEVFPAPQYRVGMLHGQMPAAEKEEVMRAFASGAVNLLVATTVIEVGVDVPNATVIVIEDAQRFGLTQLHQLRGRVGRGAEKSYCFLMTKYDIQGTTRQRLQIMEKTNDGFKIAEADLQLRGPGELGGLMQSGKEGGAFSFASALEDTDIIQAMRTEVRELYRVNPMLEGKEYEPLCAFMARRGKKTNPIIVKIG